MRVSTLFVAVVLVAADARAQAVLHNGPDAATTSPSAVTTPPPAAAGTIFRSGVDVVALNVVVTDGGARFVTGLQPADFAVYEDGVLQDVSFFSATAVAMKQGSK